MITLHHIPIPPTHTLSPGSNNKGFNEVFQHFSKCIKPSAWFSLTLISLGAMIRQCFLTWVTFGTTTYQLWGCSREDSLTARPSWHLKNISFGNKMQEKKPTCNKSLTKNKNKTFYWKSTVLKTEDCQYLVKKMEKDIICSKLLRALAHILSLIFSWSHHNWVAGPRFKLRSMTWKHMHFLLVSLILRPVWEVE